MPLNDWEAVEGAPTLPGATWLVESEAWNFSLFSEHATRTTLLLYSTADLVTPVLTVELERAIHKSGRIWHVIVPRASAPTAALYAWRVDGPRVPRDGQLFDGSKILTDPYARRLVFPSDFSRDAATLVGVPNDGRAALGVLPTPEDEPFDRGEAPRPRHAGDTVVYEVHVRGFTKSPSSGVPEAHRGTFLGLIDKIPYLARLGVTVVELLPVHQFDPHEGNYWGYMTMSFFAPHEGYAVRDAVAEFRQMVRAMHEAGIEVWLDVVYNHTAEAGRDGPTYSLRGIDNENYYVVEPDGSYDNDSGCGNTTRAAHPAVRVLVAKSLRYWATEMGVDGFRFDLASILARDLEGQMEALPALISEVSVIAADLGVTVVAEAWDLGAYLLGQGFPGLLWRQWNGRFRDDVRAFVRGDDGKVRSLVTRMYGSDDLFPDGPGDTYRPYQSVNFVTAHDGFCLYDLVSYDRKHNDANGHGGADGTDDNLSWNCGWEGDDGVPPEVLRLRTRQIKNFATILMMSGGTPMIVAGDEFGHTQGGNNNPYNQDNATTWLDWDRLEAHGELFDFWSALIAFRKSHRSIARSHYWREDVSWFGVDGPVDDASWSHSLGWLLRGSAVGEVDLCVLVNAHHEQLVFDLNRTPAARSGPWRRVVDTSRGPGRDIVDVDGAIAAASSQQAVGPRSVVVLVGPDPADRAVRTEAPEPAGPFTGS